MYPCESLFSLSGSFIPTLSDVKNVIGRCTNEYVFLKLAYKIHILAD